MSFLAIVLLAFSLSVDAFAVSVGRGAALGRARLSEALRSGAVFGLVEAITPLIGWAAGFAASALVEAVDHWIAFVLLAGVGARMIYEAVRSDEPANGVADAAKSGSLPVLLVTAIGTSLDSMAVGVSLAFLKVNIFVVAMAIGTATFLMSSVGMMIGRAIGARWGQRAEIAAGLVLVGIGAMILYQHMQ